MACSITEIKNNRAEHWRCKNPLACFVWHMICDQDRGIARDLSTHGVNCGYSYVTYTSDIVDVFNVYKKEIEAMASEFADSCGSTVAEDYQACIKRGIGVNDDHDGYVTFLVWCAVESICHNISEEGFRGCGVS